MVPQRFDQPGLQPLASRFHKWYPTPLLEANPTTQDYAYGATVTSPVSRDRDEAGDDDYDATAESGFYDQDSAGPGGEFPPVQRGQLRGGERLPDRNLNF